MGCHESASFSSVKYVSRNKFVCYARHLHKAQLTTELHLHSLTLSFEDVGCLSIQDTGL